MPLEQPPASAVLPRLVATDLDGTLLDATGRVGDRTREVLAALEAQGVPTVFVTGRPLRWMVDLWAEVGDVGIAVCSNGAVVYDVAEHEVRAVRPVPAATVLEVAEAVRAAAPGARFAVERLDGLAHEPDFLPGSKRFRAVAVDSLEALLARGEGPEDQVVKLLVRHREADPEEFWRTVAAAADHLVTTTWSSVGALVEISALGVTKASTLELLCADLGVTREQVVAFGDMPNDVALLRWAGTAYAMENAHPEVVAAADRRCGHHDADGVAEALAELFGL